MPEMPQRPDVKSVLPKTTMNVHLRTQLMRDEGESLKPYKDSRGFWTIGIGRCLDTRGITHTEALFLLDDDIADFSKEIFEALPWAATLDDARLGVLVNLAFNLGLAGLLEFRNMLLAVRLAQWDKAAEHLLSSIYAEQVGDRAKRLAKQLTTGVWQ